MSTLRTLPRRLWRTPRRHVTRLALLLVAVAVASFGMPVTVGAQSAPGPVTELSAWARGTEVVLTWVAPSSGDAPTGYEYQQRVGQGAFGSWIAISGSDQNTVNHLLTGLNNGSPYHFRVRATNATGDGDASNEVSGTPGGTRDYDLDNDKLIEVDSLAKLNAMRWDLDGDGLPTTNAADYGSAFPNAGAAMGCSSTCTGYELTNNLDFDTNGDDKTHEPKFSEGDDCAFANDEWSGADCDFDDYWNSGAGWAPVGAECGSSAYDATFEGNDFAIGHLHVNLDGKHVGLFGCLEENGEIRNIEITDAWIFSRAGRPVGVIVGHSNGTISKAFSSGEISRGGVVPSGSFPGFAWRGAAGGIVGYSEGTVTRSGSSVSIYGIGTFGGLVGFNRRDNNRPGNIYYSYATGDITFTGNGIYGGLVGLHYTGDIEYTYATGDVENRAPGRGSYCMGGLIGRLQDAWRGDLNTVKYSYSMGDVDGRQGSSRNECAIGGIAGLATGAGEIRILDSYTMSSIYDIGSNEKCRARDGCYAGPILGQGVNAENLTVRINDSFAVGHSGVAYHEGVVGRDSVQTLLGTTYQVISTHFSYWDTDSTPRRTDNTPVHGGGVTRNQLQSPTSVPGQDSDGRYCTSGDYDGNRTYCGWPATLWDFGNSMQYPLLKVDLNDDGVATAAEFGPQKHDIAPRISAKRTVTLDQGTTISEGRLPVSYLGNGAHKFSVTGAPPGVLYAADGSLSGTPTIAASTQYAMTVADSDDNTAASDTATATITFTVRPAVPTAPVLTATPAAGGARLSWTGGGTYKTGWEYAASTEEGTTGEWVTIPNSDADTDSYTVTQLTGGTTYYLKVRAVNGTEGEAKGAESNEATVVPTAPAAPPPLFPVGPPVVVPPIYEPDPIEELCPADEVPDAGFTDLVGWPEEFIVAINCMAWYGLTNGTTPTTFSPTQQLTRAQQVLFLQRIRNIATSTETTDAGSFAENVKAAVESLVELGVLADLEYAAGEEAQTGVDRGLFGEGLHKSLRTLNVAFATGLPNPFDDTDDRTTAQRQAATQLADREVMRGIAEGQFAPERPITRAQAVLVMSRVFTLPEITATPTRPS